MAIETQKLNALIEGMGKYQPFSKDKEKILKIWETSLVTALFLGNWSEGVRMRLLWPQCSGFSKSVT